MKKIPLALVLALTLVAVGCVLRTEHKIDAHITLDIRHVEEEVEGVFDFVEGKTDELPEIQEEDLSEQSRLLRHIQDFLAPVRVVHAQTSDEVKRIAKSLRERHPKVAKWKNEGCLGENNRGYLELRDCGATSDAEQKNKVQQLLSEENKDRKALYNEMARLKNLSVSKMEAISAKDKRERASKGEWVQAPPAGKYLEEFKASSAGKRLGSKVEAGAWVQIP